MLRICSNKKEMRFITLLLNERHITTVGITIMTFAAAPAAVSTTKIQKLFE
jgi:hypothetical protein